LVPQACRKHTVDKLARIFNAHELRSGVSV